MTEGHMARIFNLAVNETSMFSSSLPQSVSGNPLFRSPECPAENPGHGG